MKRLTAKPTVFLSHSSKNRAELMRLKQLLDTKAVGAIEFFLASDDESIRLGKPWPEEIYSALKRAKLMFVFVTQESLQSGWTYFEAGYGFCRLERVIPFCLPGLDKGSVRPPLGLLQARNLHGARDLSILVALCNEQFETSIPKVFSRAEFDQIFRKQSVVDAHVDWFAHAERLTVDVFAREDSAEIFADIAERNALSCDRTGLSPNRTPRVIASGVTLFREHDYSEEFADYLREGKPRRKTSLSVMRFTFEASPEMVDETFPVIDEWRDAVNAGDPAIVELEFGSDIMKEHKAHELTRRIHRSPISLLSDGRYRFENVDFTLESQPHAYRNLKLRCERFGTLTDLPLSEMVTLLFSLGVVVDTATPRSRRR